MNVDMSPMAVTIRLKRVSQLRRLCLELGKMKPVATEAKSADGMVADEKLTGEPEEDRTSSNRP